MSTCPNLLALYGKKYRITFDPCYDRRKVPRKWLDPWMMQVPCRGDVTIYPVGEDRVAVELDYHPGLPRKVAALPGVVCTQDGDQEKTFTFPLALFDRVAEIVKPHKRRVRVLTPAQRELQAKHLAEIRPQTRIKTP
jgi:hypothetical protein